MSVLMEGWDCPTCGRRDQASRKCRSCKSEYGRRYRAVNWESIAARARCYRLAHKDEESERNRRNKQKRSAEIALVSLAQMGIALLDTYSKESQKWQGAATDPS